MQIVNGMTILSGEDIKNLKVRAGDYCDTHHRGYVGPECSKCSVEAMAEATKAEELKYISK